MLRIPHPLSEMLTCCCGCIYCKTWENWLSEAKIMGIPMYFTNIYQLKKIKKEQQNFLLLQIKRILIKRNTSKWNSVAGSLTPFLRAQLSAASLISDRHTNTFPWHCYNFPMSPITELLGPALWSTEGSSPHVRSTKYLSLLSVCS